MVHESSCLLYNQAWCKSSFEKVNTAMRKPLPVTTSTFRDIIENGFLEVEHAFITYLLSEFSEVVNG